MGSIEINLSSGAGPDDGFGAPLAGNGYDCFPSYATELQAVLQRCSIAEQKAEAAEQRAKAAERAVADLSANLAADKQNQAENPNNDGLDNAYSYCVHEMLWPRSVPAALFSLFSLFALLLAQAVLAFGFCDASRLEVFLGQLPAFADPIQVSTFYPESARTGVGKDQVAPNVTAITVSLFLLGLLMKRDNLSTLTTAHPLDAVLYQDWRRDEWGKGGLLLLLWRAVAAGVLMVCWGVRSLAMPTLAGIGCALALAATNNTRDIVLNSVAIGCEPPPIYSSFVRLCI